MRRLLPLLLLAALPVLLFASLRRWGGELAPAVPFPPASLPVASPERPIVSLELCEDYCLEVDDLLEGLALALEHSEPESARAHLSPGFLGTDWAALELPDTEAQSLETRRAHLRVPAATSGVDRDAFLAGLFDLLGPHGEDDDVQMTLERAEFQVGAPLWGRIEVVLEHQGSARDGSIRSLEGRVACQVVKDRGRWLLHAWELFELESRQRARPLFTEVTEEAGLSHVDDTALLKGSQRWNGAACSDVDGDGLFDIFVPSLRRNFLYMARRSGVFEDEAERRGVAQPAGGTAPVFLDHDNDGDPDLLLGDEGFESRDGVRGNGLRLYRQDRDGDDWRFVDVSQEAGLGALRYTFALTVLDYDRDGFLDFYVGNYGRHATERNNSWIHADNAQANQLYRNVQGRRFVEVTAEAGVGDGRWTYAAAAADYDRDGDVDLYVVNDFGPNQLLRNEGDGRFSDATNGEVLEDLGFGMSASWCDLNNDGLLDLYVSNMWSPVAHRILARLTLEGEDVRRMHKMAAGNSILLGREDGSFERAPAELGGVAGRWAWASVPLDVDLDGRLDVFCTNGFMTRSRSRDVLTFYWRNVIASSIAAEEEPSILVRRDVGDLSLYKHMQSLVWREGYSYSGHERDKLWIQRDGAGFWDVSPLSGVDAAIDGRAAIAADFDDDGDPDLFVHAIQGHRHHLYRNDATEPAGRFLKVQLRATRGQYQAVGAQVRVHGPRGPCSQVLALGSQYLSCQPPELVFGVGELDEVRVEVLWPGGAQEDFGQVAAGTRVLLVEGEGQPRPLALHPRFLGR